MNSGKRGVEPGDRRPEAGDWRLGKATPNAGGFRRPLRAFRFPVSELQNWHSPLQPPVSALPKAFTLLELLLSLALVGLLLVAMNQFIFSMGELWGRGVDVRLFEQHVRAVTRFVEQTLHSAAQPTAKGEQALAIQEIRLPDGPTGSLLTFELLEGSRVLPWPGTPLPDVVCALGVRQDRGLVLYWHSRLEQHFADEPPRAAVLTPLVTGLSYDYYDANFNSWQNLPTPQRDRNGQWQLPTRLRLRFTYGKLTRETIVTVPPAVQTLPLF